MIAAGARSLAFDEGEEGIDGRVEVILDVHERGAERAGARDLIGGDLEAPAHLFRCLAAAPGQVRFEGGRVGGFEGDEERIREHGAQRLSTLHVHADDDVLAGLQRGADRLPRDAVEVAVDLGVLEQLAGGDLLQELLARHEVVVDALVLSLAGGAGGHRRGAHHGLAAIDGAVDHGVLADTRGAGEDDDERRAILGSDGFAHPLVRGRVLHAADAAVEGLGGDRDQRHPLFLHHDDRLRAAPAREIDGTVLLLGALHHALHRRRCGRGNRQHAVQREVVVEADVDEF